MLEGFLSLIVFMLFCIIFSLWMMMFFMFISPDLAARRSKVLEARRNWEDIDDDEYNEKKPPTD